MAGQWAFTKLARSILDHRLHVVDLFIALPCLLDDDEQVPQSFPALFYEVVDFLLHLDVQHGFDNSVATLGGLIRHVIPSLSISYGVASIQCQRNPFDYRSQDKTFFPKCP
jgi:hypothetical protein